MSARADTQGGTITTIAGNGTRGATGDCGPAISATLSGVMDVAVDSSGNLYIVEEGNGRVRKVSPAGIITTVAGGNSAPCTGEPAPSGSLFLPSGLAVDTAGNIFVADRGDNRIVKISPSGIFTIVAGKGVSGFSGDGGPATAAALAGPSGVAVDPAGNLFIADSDNNRIRKVSADGTISTIAGAGNAADSGDGGLATAAAVYSPWGIAVDTSGNIFFSETFSRRVRKIAANGVITTVVGNGDFELGGNGDGGPASSATVSLPSGLAIDAAGNLFIADGGDSRIRRISTSGIITSVAGNGNAGFSGDGGPAILASLNNPHGVAVDTSGNLFIAQYDDNRVREVSAPPVDKIENLVLTGTATCTESYCAHFGSGPITGTYSLDVTAQAIVGPWSFSTPFGKMSSTDAGATATVETGDVVEPVFQVQTSSSVQFIKFYFAASNLQQTGAIIAGPGSDACINIPGTTLSCAPDYLLTGSTAIAGAPPPPSINPGGVVPVYSTSTTIQPGEWVSIYGTNLAGTTALWNGDFPTTLGGTSVTINGKSAYLSYVSPALIDLQAPDDTSTGSVVVAVTNTNGTASSTVTLAGFGPSFSLLDNRHVAGVIVRSDGSGAYGGGAYDILGPTGSSLGYATVAAKPGDNVELFAVGLGPTNPSVPAGKPFSGSAQTTNTVGLLVKNIAVTPTFAGLSEAGLYQINFTVPAGLGTGDVALTANVGGTHTPAGVVISVAAPVVTPPVVPQVRSVTFSPASVGTGGTSTGTVTLSSAAPAGGAVVAISSNSTLVTVPATATVAAGATAATFTASAGSVSSSQLVTITASYAGTFSQGVLTLVASGTGTSSCQPIAEGPYQFQVLNRLTVDAEVDFGDVILPGGQRGSLPFGSEMRPNECDIIGLPEIATYTVSVSRLPNGAVVNNSLTFSNTTSGFIFNGRSAYTLIVTQGNCSAAADQGMTFEGKSVYSLCVP